MMSGSENVWRHDKSGISFPGHPQCSRQIAGKDEISSYFRAAAMEMPLVRAQSKSALRNFALYVFASMVLTLTVFVARPCKARSPIISVVKIHIWSNMCKRANVHSMSSGDLAFSTMVCILEMWL